MSKENPVAICRENVPLGRLVRHFHDREKALSFFADYMQSSYPRKTGHVCDFCSSENNVSRNRFVWSAFYSTSATAWSSILGTVALSSLGIVHFVSKKIEFSTHHHLCKKCVRKAKFMSGLGYAVSKLGFAILILSLIEIVMTVVMGTVLMDHPSKREISTFVIFILAGFVGVGLTIGLCRSGEKAAVPKSLRKVGRFPFVLTGIKRDK